MSIVKLENIGKKFEFFSYKDKAPKELAFFLPDQKKSAEFWALQGITIQIEKGRVAGIIGRNGAGKTTLFNIIAGVSTPTVGKIEIGGRVASLISLGAGFQEELTGKENIYLNSSILGMNRNEIDKKYLSIVQFSELDSFLDSPLHAYSQGMRLRLGFSIAIHMDFDILLIDEIMSVGDISFQKKCFKKIEELKKEGKTMIITTQALDVIERLCDEVFVLEEGSIIFKGSPTESSDRYRKLLNERSFLESRHPRESLVTRTKRWADDRNLWGKKDNTGNIAIDSVKIFNKWGNETGRFRIRETMIIQVSFRARTEVKDIHFGVALFREDGVYCYGPNTRWDGYYIDVPAGRGWFSIEYKDFFLAPGVYYFSVAIWDKEELSAYDYHRGCYKIEIIGKNLNEELLNLPFNWSPISKLPIPRFLNPYDSVNLRALKNKEQHTKQVEWLKIKALDFIDRENNAKDIFVTGEELGIRVGFEQNKEKIFKNFKLWIGIFRSDGIYCHGVCRKISIKNRTITLRYPNFQLLPGSYQLSIGVWDTARGEFIVCHHRIYSFNVVFSRDDHGTIYLKHRWKWGFYDLREGPKCSEES